MIYLAFNFDLSTLSSSHAAACSISGEIGSLAPLKTVCRIDVQVRVLPDACARDVAVSITLL